MKFTDFTVKHVPKTINVHRQPGCNHTYISNRCTNICSVFYPLNKDHPKYRLFQKMVFKVRFDFMFLLLPDIPRKKTPHTQLHIQPSNNSNVVRSCSNPIPKLIQQLPKRELPDKSSFLAQQHALNPANIVPEIYNMDMNKKMIPRFKKRIKNPTFPKKTTCHKPSSKNGGQNVVSLRKLP